MRRFLAYIAPKSFNDGLNRCNQKGMKLITVARADRFLDIGCGDGTLTLQFAEVIKAREIFGVEFVDEVRSVAERKGINCTKFDLNSEWDFEDGFFDIILSSQIIEHLHNTRLNLEESFRCLKPGGQLIVLTENLASWVNTAALLFGWQPFSTTNINGWSLGNPLIWHKGEKKDAELYEKYQATGVSGTTGHVRVLSYTGLRDLLEKVGFRNIQIYSKGYLPLWGMLSDLFCSIDKRHGHFLVATGYK